MKRAICLLLTLILGFSFVGCTKKTPTGSPGGNVPSGPVEIEGNHESSAQETDDYMVHEGVSDYKIVLPETVTTYIAYARDELIRFFGEATGITLPIATEKDLTHTADGKYISLGDTSLFASSGLTVDKKALKRDGLRIITKDKTVYIVGGSEQGVLYGVHDFLNITFNFEVYYKDCYTLNTGVKDLKLRDYNVTDIPDIAYRTRAGILNSSTQDADDIMFGYRMRALDSYGDFILPIHSGEPGKSPYDNGHNSFFFLPTDDYKAEHPDWYSTENEQLCYTARGNEESLELMIDTCVEKAIASLKYYTPDKYAYRAIHIGIMDNWKTCKCQACNAVKAAHNDADSAAILMFVNRMGKKINDWMEEPENAQYKRDLIYTFFAYQSTLTVPFTVQEDGSYEFADDLKAPEGVKVQPFFAFSTFDWSKSLYASNNDEPRIEAERWAKSYSDGWAWSYGGIFSEYFIFSDVYNFYAEFYNFLARNKFEYTFAQMHSRQRGADTGFFTFANYIMCKLAWNSSLDLNELIENYFSAMYGDAAKPMKELFQDLRVWYATYSANLGWSQNQRFSGKWDFGRVRGWQKKLDEAYAAIEKYKKDEVTYNRLKSHIDIEWLFPAYVTLKNFTSNLTTAELSELKTTFKTVCTVLQVTHEGESQTIDAFLATL